MNQRRRRVAAASAAAFVLALVGLALMPAFAASTPSAPSGLAVAPGDGSVTVSFDGSASAGSSPILYYRVSIVEKGTGTGRYVDGTGSPITIGGLTNGVEYTVKVKARNSSGFGSSSKPVPAFVPVPDRAGALGSTTETPQPTDPLQPTDAPSPPATSPPASDSPSTTERTPADGAASPGQILDLHTWRLGLPTDSEGGTSGKSLEVKQPRLLTFTDGDFFANSAGDGVVFRAGVDGATTSGSKYPRSELRELTPEGEPAAWSAETGTHTMTISGSVDHLPMNKPQVVAAQIHTAHGSDALELMATGYCTEKYCGPYRNTPKGTVQLVTKENGDQSHGLVDPQYALGTRYTVSVEVAAGRRVTITYRNLASGYTSTRSFTIESTDTLYFKAGCYTQSNLSRDSSSAFGQTTVNAVTVKHTS
jgi:hypothetical protein